MKHKYTIFGMILAVAGLAFLVIALTNPQLSFPWPNWVSYTFYGFYVMYTVLIFCMPKLKNASVAGCIIIAFEFFALGLIILSISTRNTANDWNWYLPVGLCISALAQFANLYVVKRRKKNNQE